MGKTDDSLVAAPPERLLRLFAVRNVTNDILVTHGDGKDMFFVNKMDAKAVRDDLNRVCETCSFEVTRGPDHWRGEVVRCTSPS
jgi:hypothetical protein